LEEGDESEEGEFAEYDGDADRKSLSDFLNRSAALIVVGRCSDVDEAAASGEWVIVTVRREEVGPEEGDTCSWEFAARVVFDSTCFRVPPL
jgi:hypothetical protein